EHPGGVRGGLLAAELAARGRDDQRRAAQVRDAHSEGDAGAGGGLVEDDRDRLRTGERLAGPAVLLQLDREIEHLALLGRGQIVVAKQVAGHAGVSMVSCADATVSSAARKSVRNSDTSASPMVKAGAMRMTSAVGALMISPR